MLHRLIKPAPKGASLKSQPEHEMIYLEFIYKDHVYRATINCLVSLKNYCKEETREFNFGRIQFNSNCTKELKSSVIDYLMNYTTGV